MPVAERCARESSSYGMLILTDCFNSSEVLDVCNGDALTGEVAAHKRPVFLLRCSELARPTQRKGMIVANASSCCRPNMSYKTSQTFFLISRYASLASLSVFPSKSRQNSEWDTANSGLLMGSPTHVIVRRVLRFDTQVSLFSHGPYFAGESGGLPPTRRRHHKPKEISSNLFVLFPLV
jgi:hypothetical protein